MVKRSEYEGSKNGKSQLVIVLPLGNPAWKVYITLTICANEKNTALYYLFVAAVHAHSSKGVRVGLLGV